MSLVQPAALAATALIVRDGAAGLEVLLVERHRAIEFAGGASVFPGGRVHEGDADAGLRARCRGVEGLAAEQAALRVAAIRESFEEAGILLARPRGGASLVSALRLADLLKRYHADVRGDRIEMGELAAREDLELACDLLVPFAHWITPEAAPKRFDTHFFLVAAPPDQIAVHDGGESVGSLWLAPQRALDDAAAGSRSIVFPTRMNLAKLARSASVAESLENARRNPPVTVLPRVERGGAGWIVRIPAEAGYDVVEAPVDEIMASSRPR